jgi:MHS family proline/betaine transporter-like MFS transporter
MLAVSPVTLAAGWLSDRIGRRKLLFAATTIGLLGAQPFFMLMHHQSAGLILAGQLGFVISLGLGFGVTPAMMVEISPAPVRCTAIALGSGLSFSIIGGLVPLTATWLMHRTGDALSPAWLVMAAALVTCLTVLAQNETFRQELGTAASEPARA